MISRIQKTRLLSKILQEYYSKGEILSTRDLFNIAAQRLGDSRYGQPLFNPRPASRELIVDPKALETNLQEVKEDLSVLYEDLVDLAAQEVGAYQASYGELSFVRQKLLNLSQNLDSLLARQSGTNSLVFYDNFRNTSKIDLTRTTALVDPDTGTVSLPLSKTKSSRITGIVVLKETLPVGANIVAGAFSDVLNDSINRTFQVSTTQGIYQVILDLDGLRNINQVSVDPLAPLTFRIEYSTDGQTWYPLSSQYIDSKWINEFSPIQARQMRISLSGNIIGLRNFFVGQITTSSQGVLVSDPFTSSLPVGEMEFSWNSIVPHGSSIRPFVSVTPDGPWEPISPGIVDLAGTFYQTIVFSTSGSLVPDNISDPGTLWLITPITASGVPAPLPQTGELLRGIGQFYGEAFWYDWNRTGDTFHLPDLTDWNRNLSNKQWCYLSPSSGGTDSSLPTSLGNFESPLLSAYSRNGNTWWGVAVTQQSTSLLQDGWNYRFTTYLYSDRDRLTPGGGGAYAIGNLSGTPGKYVDWSLYVNEVRVGASNLTYPISLLPTGTVSYQVIIQNDTPNSYYRFDDNSSTLTDSSGNGHTGSYHNTQFVTYQVPGALIDPLDKTVGFYWDGSSPTYGYAQAPGGAFDFSGTGWSIECWVRNNQLPIQYPLFSRSGIYLQMGPGSNGGAGPTFVGPIVPGMGLTWDAWPFKVALPDTAWHHFVVTYDAITSTPTLYLDGIQVYIATGPVWVDGAGGTTFITPVTRTVGQGVMDELALYKHVLTASQVQAHYSAGVGDLANSGTDLNFSLPFKSGWNKIELLVYQPPRGQLSNSMTPDNQNVLLLFKPDIFSFSPNIDWINIPELSEYPLVADGRPMDKVSEFILKWNTPPWKHNRWAWRIENGVVTAGLLNYNPSSDSGYTLDKLFKGSHPVFRLRYPYTLSPTNTFYFKAELSRSEGSDIGPRLLDYKFVTT